MQLEGWALSRPTNYGTAGNPKIDNVKPRGAEPLTWRFRVLLSLRERIEVKADGSTIQQ
jgi:hypothetical protein